MKPESEKQKTQPTVAHGRSLWGDAWQQLRRSRLSMVCLWIIAFYAVLALVGEGQFIFYQWQDRVAPYNETHLELQYQAPSFAHPFGTDGLGRDVGTRLLQGTRIAFQVGIVTSLIAIPIGVILGCLAGYFGGRTDDFIVWLFSTFAAIPGLLFIFAIAMVVGKGLLGIYLGIGLTTWVNLCRLIRAEVLKHKARPYVLAARALGLSHARIIFRHILPNVFHIVIVTFTLRFSYAIGTEVFMSFLGIGVQGEPSWGLMISNARLRLWYGVWWEMAFSTLAIFVIVLAFNLLGDALRDALDPRLRTREG